MKKELKYICGHSDVYEIVFVNMPSQDYNRIVRLPFDLYIPPPPLGLGYLATICEKDGFKVGVLDAEALKLSPIEIVRILRKVNPKIIGFNSMSTTYPLLRSIIKSLGKDGVIIGGPHATLLPQQVLEDTRVDIVVRGEAEETILKILKNGLDEDLSSIDGISYRKDGEIIHNADREVVDDLDVLPFVNRDFFIHDPHFEGKMIESHILTSRGCPHQCTFCSVPSLFGKKLRCRSVKNVVDEIEYLQMKYSVNQIHFIDDNFVFSERRVLEFVKEMEKRRIKINWRALSRVDVFSNLNESTIRKMKESGCYKMCFGIESCHPKILEITGKRTTVQQAEKALHYCKNSSILTEGYFMLGFPTETEEEMDETISKMKEMALDVAYFHFAKPFPGTTLFKCMLNEGWPEEDIAHLCEQPATVYVAKHQAETSSFPALFIEKMPMREFLKNEVKRQRNFILVLNLGDLSKYVFTPYLKILRMTVPRGKLI